MSTPGRGLPFPAPGPGQFPCASMVPSPPVVDAERIDRLRDALTGGLWGDSRDVETAAEIERGWPGTAELITCAREYHRRTAARAVTGTFACEPARSVVFTASGLPHRDGPLHAKATRIAPGTRVAYVHACRPAALLARVELQLPDPEHVTVIQPEAEDPETWLATAAAWELLELGPVSVHVVLAAHRWTGCLAAEVLMAYRRGLPAGSSVCMTLVTAAGPRRGVGRVHVGAGRPGARPLTGSGGRVGGVRRVAAAGDDACWPGRPAAWAPGARAGPGEADGPGDRRCRPGPLMPAADGFRRQATAHPAAQIRERGSPISLSRRPRS